jgi:hypothetical protein
MAQAGDPMPEPAIARLHEIERHFDGVEVKWRERVVSDAALDEPEESDVRPGRLDEKIVTKRLLFKGDMLRYQTEDEAQRERSSSFEYALGAEKLVMHTPDGSPGRNNASAIIHRRASTVGQNMNCTPCVLCFRPLYARFGGVNETKCKVNYQTSGVQISSPADVAGQQYLVELSSGGQIIKWQLSVNGKLFQQVEIQYDGADADAIRLPKSWKLSTIAANGHVLQSLTSTVEYVRLRPELTAKDFEVVFKPGTRVTDKIANTKYIVQADEKAREILPSEITQPNSVLMATKTGEIEKKSSGSARWIVATTVLLGLVVGVVTWWRRKIT